MMSLEPIFFLSLTGLSCHYSPKSKKDSLFALLQVAPALYPGLVPFLSASSTDSHDAGLLLVGRLLPAFVPFFDSLPDVLRAEIERSANGEKRENPIGVIAKKPFFGFRAQTLGVPRGRDKLVLEGLHCISEDSAH